MSRIIRFRAKKASGFGFVTGDLIPRSDVCEVVDDSDEIVYVFYDSIQESTGLVDDEGQEIFNGDVLDTKNSTMDIKVRVVWDQDNACYRVDYLSGGRYGSLTRRNASNWHILR